MNQGKGAEAREKEFNDNDFTLFKKKKKVRNPSQIFDVLRNQLHKDKVWCQKKMVLVTEKRIVFYLRNTRGESVWDHLDAAIFDSACRKWLERVYNSIVMCSGSVVSRQEQEEEPAAVERKKKAKKAKKTDKVSEDTTTYGNNSLRYHGAGLWNNLPNDLKDARMDEVRYYLKTWSPNTDFQ